VAAVDIGCDLDVSVEEFFSALRRGFFDLACMGRCEFQLIGIDEAGLDEGAGLARALAGVLWPDQTAVVLEVFGEIAAGAREDLAEVVRGYLTDFSADQIADLEDFSQDVGKTLATVEAEEGSDEAVAACFLGKYFYGDGDRARVGRVEVRNLAQTGRGCCEGAYGVGGGPCGFSDVDEMVDGDAIEPGTELGFSAEAREGGDGFEEDFLGGVFGVGAAMEHAEGEVEDPREVACDEKFELVAVGGEGAGEELFVGWVGEIVCEGVCEGVGWQGGSGRH
jgi:hypothetical protein